jgi:hypothetical protein
MLRGEFLGFHHHIMQPSTARKMLKIAHFQHIGQAAGFIGYTSIFLSILSKSEHLAANTILLQYLGV